MKVFIKLTMNDASGTPVYVNAARVDIVRGSLAHESPKPVTLVEVGANTLYVVESVDEIARRLRETQ